MVSVDACTYSGGVIRLPGGASYVITEATETFPQTIEAVKLATNEEVIGSERVFDAVLLEQSHFTVEDKLYYAWVPADAVYYDGTLVRLTDGRALVWGSKHRSLNPPMDDFVSEDDPRMAQAGDRIHRAYPASS